MDLTKFISLLHKQAIFFCRVDKLEDKFEGRAAKTNYKERKDQLKYMLENKIITANLTEEEIEKDLENDLDFEEKQRSLNCIACWNKDEGESAALWKIYSDFQKGIMIKSSISRIEKAFEGSTENISMSEIRYKDYSKEALPWGNSIYPFLFKQKAYHYESEVRLIHEVESEIGWIHDWSKEEVEEGVYIKTNLEELIDSIIISPNSPKWFFELVETITKKFELNVTVEKSKLSF
jgi:hypothetical protein